MSVIGKKWLIKNSDPDKSVFDKILQNRGPDNLIEPGDFHDPFLFHDMQMAVERIMAAIRGNQRIIVFGDYDVDGITAAAILIHTFKKLNANVSYRLPNRVTDGYGLSEKFIDEFIEKKIDLVITVDCGISCHSEIEKAALAGVDIIVTDHHTIPEILPEHAYAILHPKAHDHGYPFSELTGAGVALKLAHALIKSQLDKSEQEDFLSSLLDLATLGTVADLGPLIGENRLIVKRGLQVLANTRWHGLKRIKQLANIREGDIMDPIKIGFQIAPRINAAGRIGDPYVALQLLLQDAESEKTVLLGDYLESLNKERQQLTEKALNQIEERLLKGSEMSEIVVAHDPDWHVGILGLIAGKIADRYGRPAIILQDLGDNLVASARSPEYFNVVDALTAFKDQLISFGGHAQAAGFNIKKENLEIFTNNIKEYAREKLKNQELLSTLEIDCLIKEDEVNLELLENILQLQPFGVSNRKPTFLMRDVTPFFVEHVGSQADHVKFSLKIGNREHRVIGFRLGPFRDDLLKQPKIDLVFHLEKNRWQNRSYLELQALDFRSATL